MGGINKPWPYSCIRCGNRFRSRIAFGQHDCKPPKVETGLAVNAATEERERIAPHPPGQHRHGCYSMCPEMTDAEILRSLGPKGETGLAV